MLFFCAFGERSAMAVEAAHECGLTTARHIHGGIDAWAVDEEFWVRRSALLALLPGIRAGQPDLERFERYAALMLLEKEFFIRKATGWVLREISKRDPRWVAGPAS